MPINRKYPLAVLLDACRKYPLRPREYFTFEYVLLGGVNDSPEDARRVVRLLAHLRAKVNLIPWNPGNLPYRAPTAESIEEFQEHPDGKRCARIRALFARAGCICRVRPAGVDGIRRATGLIAIAAPRVRFDSSSVDFSLRIAVAARGKNQKQNETG